jgi:hypothetical protein
MEPIVVMGAEKASEVTFEVLKVAVPVGTTAGDQLAAASKSEVPGVDDHVAF